MIEVVEDHPARGSSPGRARATPSTGVAPPTGWRRRVPAGSGRSLTVRDATAADRPALVEHYRRLSPEDTYRRFFSGGPPAAALVDQLLRAAEHGGARLVATSDDGAIVGECGYVPIADDDAELDITVRTHHRGWLGPVLLDALVDLARERGIRNLVAEILESNPRMLALVHRRGCVTLRHEDASIVVVAIGARHPVPDWPARRPPARSPES